VRVAFSFSLGAKMSGAPVETGDGGVFFSLCCSPLLRAFWKLEATAGRGLSRGLSVRAFSVLRTKVFSDRLFDVASETTGSGAVSGLVTSGDEIAPTSLVS
jgi:hypothetical protein